MLPVRVLAIFLRNVAFGKPGDADGKISRRADEFDKLRRKFKPAGRGLKFPAAGRIAPQRENIFTAETAKFFQQRANFSARMVDAGEMREGGEAMLALDAIDDHQRFVTRAAARSVSHRAKIGARGEQCRDLPVE